MALVTKATAPSIDTINGIKVPPVSALVAGEALTALAPCYVSTDGKVYQATGAAANAAAKVRGFTPKAYGIGAAVSLFGTGCRAEYGVGMTPGADLYLGATAGRLDTAATTGGTAPIAWAINATEIMIQL